MRPSVLLFELSIIPAGGGRHTSALLAEILRLIDRSGLPYQLTPSATCLQGTWNEVMPLIQRCQSRAAARAGHVVTLLKIEHDEDTARPLERYPESVKEKARRPLRTAPARRRSSR